MVLIDNKTSFLKDDLVKTIEKGNKISIAATCFSMYAYNELKEQLQLEDMSTWLSIMDLDSNEFRLDLLDHIKSNGDMDKKPKSMHAVVKATEGNKIDWSVWEEKTEVLLTPLL